MSNKCYLTEVVLLTKSYNLQDFEDWMHWHLDIIGFEHCHVFDNESSVDIKSACDSYGDYKGTEYKKPGYVFFIESSLNEAKRIKEVSGKTVFCIETMSIV